MQANFLENIWPDWQIIKEIGRGSYGIVYEAARIDSLTDTRSAIKVIHIPSDPAELNALHSEGLTESETKTYLQGIVDDCINEVKLMESFKGTNNVVSVEDYKVIEDPEKAAWTIYIRMELLTPLPAYIKARDLDEEETVKLGVDICNALDRCEQLNVIHRDIKPENIFVNSFGDYKIGDFGIAKNLGNMTGSLSMKGTMNYMAPEVEKGKNYDHRADIYSLGLVLYRLMNDNLLPFLERKEQMFNAKERTEALVRRLRGEPLPAPRNASGTFANVILTACDPEPDRRFRSAAEMKEALLNLEEDGRTVKVRPPKPEPEPDMPSGDEPVEKKPSRIMLIIGICVIVVAAAVILMTIKNRSDDKDETSDILISTSEESEEEAAEPKTEEAVPMPEISQEAAPAPVLDETALTEIEGILNNAGRFAAAEDYESAIGVIDEGLKKYPSSEDLTTARIEYADALKNQQEMLAAEKERPASLIDDNSKATPTPTPTVKVKQLDLSKASKVFYLKYAGKNIRSKATYDSKLVTTIKDTATPLYYFDESDYGLGSDGKTYLWYKIVLDNGVTGWIRSDFVTTSPNYAEKEQAAQQAAQAVQTPVPLVNIAYAEDVFFLIEGDKNIRSRATYASDLVTTVMDTSTPLYYFGEWDSGLGSDGNMYIWYRVFLDNYTGGWIRGDFVRSASTPVVPQVYYPSTDINATFNVKACNVRSEPTYYSELVAMLDEGDSVDFYGEIQPGTGSDGQIHNWFKVYFANTTGWIRQDFIWLSYHQGATTTKTNMRSQPTHDSGLVKTVEEGTEVFSIPGGGEGYGSDGKLHNWVHVFILETNNGIAVSGYIRSDYLVFG